MPRSSTFAATKDVETLRRIERLLASVRSCVLEVRAETDDDSRLLMDAEGNLIEIRRLLRKLLDKADR